MTLTEDSTQAIRDGLLAGITHHQDRQQHRRRLAVAAPIVALAVTVGALATGARDRSAFALTENDDGTISVEIHPDFDEVADLEQSLREVGLDAVVIHLKGHPSLDGVIEVTSHQNESSGAFEFDEDRFIIDVGATEGNVEILIYSAAQPGEDYQFAPSLFGAEQQLAGLHCAYPDEAMTTLEFEDQARSVGLDDFTWVIFDDLGPGSSAEESDRRPDGVVVDAQLANESTVRVIVTSTAIGAAATTIEGSGDGTHYRSNPRFTCTPEIAAAWPR